MRVRILAFYHDLVGRLLAEGLKPTAIHRCLLAENARVSLSAVKQYISKYPKYPSAKELYLHGCQKIKIGEPPAEVLVPNVAVKSRVVARTKRALEPYLTKVPQLEQEEAQVTQHYDQSGDLGQAKKEWWADLRDKKNNLLFQQKGDQWYYSGTELDLASIGLYAYIGSHLYARTVFPEEVRRDLQRISMQISGRVTLSLTQKLSAGKILFGFVPTFARRDRGMEEWQRFQKLPRARRRKIIVEGTLGGYFLPLSMAWSGPAGGDAPETPLNDKEYVLPEELQDPSTQQVVPQEYLDLLVDKDRLTDKLYWKTF